MSERPFKLFACNIPVRGARRSIICDLQRHEYHSISNELFEILQRHDGTSREAVKSLYPEARGPEIDGYYDFLQENELGFFLDEDPSHFPAIDLTFESPERINNAIIDVDATSDHPYAQLFEQLDALACKHVELRFYDPIDFERLDSILDSTKTGRLRSIQLLVPYDVAWSEEDFRRLSEVHARISTISVHSAPENRVAHTEKCVIVYFRQAVTSAEQCGQIHPGYFSPQLDTFSEAQRFNTCLNKKVGIDVAGNIKNCPSCSHTFGVAREASLVDIVDRREFKAVWSVHKDQVDVCRDCEFRYICTDCRAYLEDESDPLSKPAKCGYDPYSGEWQP